jgi:hypothetical protein
MKYLAGLLFLTSFSHAQTNGEDLVLHAMKDAAATFESIPEAEQKQVIAVAAELVAKHVAIRPDGSASAVYRQSPQSGNWYVEWQGLGIRRVNRAPGTDADRLNGITKRYHVAIGCTAHRDWSPGRQGWSEWRPSGFVLFPSAIVVEEVHGACKASGGSQLPAFMPGSGAATVQRPAPQESGLPPGMMRRK